jgi:hypothetical protein
MREAPLFILGSPPIRHPGLDPGSLLSVSSLPSFGHGWFLFPLFTFSVIYLSEGKKREPKAREIMTGPPLPFGNKNVHKSAPPGSRETAGARSESPDRSRKKQIQIKTKNEKANCSKPSRVRYTFHARRRKPTRNA